MIKIISTVLPESATEDWNLHNDRKQLLSKLRPLDLQFFCEFNSEVLFHRRIVCGKSFRHSFTLQEHMKLIHLKSRICYIYTQTRENNIGSATFVLALFLKKDNLQNNFVGVFITSTLYFLFQIMPNG